MNRYRLRPLLPSDADLMLRWRNSDRIRAVMYTDELITPNRHRMWFQEISRRIDICYRLFEVDGVSVGLVYFTQIDRLQKRCVWGFYLGENSLPKGTGSHLGFLGLEYAFNELDMKTIRGESFMFNFPALALHRKLGFTQETQLQTHVKKNGHDENVAVFTLTKEDWEGYRETIRTKLTAGN